MFKLLVATYFITTVQDLLFRFVPVTCISHVLLVECIQRNVRFAFILRLVSLCDFCQVQLLYWFLLFLFFSFSFSISLLPGYDQSYNQHPDIPCCLIPCFEFADFLICSQFDCLCYHLVKSMYVLRTFSVKTRYL